MLGFLLGPIGIGLLTVVLGYVLKKIPNNLLQKPIGAFAFSLGVIITLGLTRFSWSKDLWNKIIEPFIIDLIDNIFGTFVREFIRGLRSDN